MDRIAWVFLTALVIGVVRVVGAEAIRILESNPLESILVLILALLVGAPLVSWLKEKSNW